MPTIQRPRRTIAGLMLALGAALSLLLAPPEARAWRVFSNAALDGEHVAVCGDGIRTRIASHGEGVGATTGGGSFVIDVTAGTPLDPPTLPDGVVGHVETTASFSPIFIRITGLPPSAPRLYRSHSAVVVVPFAQPLAVGTEVRIFAHEPQNLPKEVTSQSGAAWVVGDCAADAPRLCDGLEPTIVGTNGPDVLKGTQGDDVILGRGGNDRIVAGAGDDTVCAGSGNDLVIGASGVDRLLGEGGADELLDTGVRGGENALLGGNGSDELRGGGATDALAGGPGADDLSGGGATDGLYGGPGPDLLMLDAGDDWLRGDAGVDAVSADTPAVTAGPVEINLLGLFATAPGLGKDSLAPGSLENARGSAFNDLLIGDDLPNVLRGLGDDDRLDGRGGSDALHGGSGTDSCSNGEAELGCEL